jgi:hypothetical protein
MMTMTKMFCMFLCLGCAVAQSSDEAEQAQCDHCGNEGPACELTECDGCQDIVCDDCRECREDCNDCRDVRRALVDAAVVLGNKTDTPSTETESDDTESDGIATPPDRFGNAHGSDGWLAAAFAEQAQDAIAAAENEFSATAVVFSAAVAPPTVIPAIASDPSEYVLSVTLGNESQSETIRITVDAEEYDEHNEYSDEDSVADMRDWIEEQCYATTTLDWNGVMDIEWHVVTPAAPVAPPAAVAPITAPIASAPAVIPVAESIEAPAAPARVETRRQIYMREKRERRQARLAQLSEILANPLRSSSDRRRRMSEGECALLMCEYTTLSFELNTEGSVDCPICFLNIADGSRSVVKTVYGHDICLQCFQTQSRTGSKFNEQCCICRVNLFDTGESEPDAPEAPADQIVLPRP